VEARVEDIDDQPIAWRSAPGDGPPVLYLHGVPDSGEMWEPFLQRTGGVAPDLPGFGRSAKRGDFPYDIDGYTDWLERFLDHLEIDRFRLVAHDWGAVGLALAQRAPERVERLVLIDAVPFLPGYRWHPVARWWRRRGPGELLMGATTRRTMAWLSRGAFQTQPPPAQLDGWWRDFDQGTQRAILQLYRSSPEERLAAAGERLERVGCPALVVWGEEDPYLDTWVAAAYASRLPRADVQLVPGAGHWPWVDVPETVEHVCRFLAAV
jgi:pimeloyl-ACP methyl ester carboxylesterase